MNRKLIVLIVVFATMTFRCTVCNGQEDRNYSELEINNRMPLANPVLVREFYKANGNHLFWMAAGENYLTKRSALLHFIEHAESTGLYPSAYSLSLIYTSISAPLPVNLAALKMDYQITDAAISFCKALYQGSQINKWIFYDGISAKYTAADNRYLLKALGQVKNGNEMSAFLLGLEPATPQYRNLKSELTIQLSEKNMLKIKQLRSSLNYYRWINHFHLDSFIVINIASATLNYHQGDSVMLQMKAVFGAPDRRTPRFAAYCKAVTLYPYWNMPHSIAINEWLQDIKRNPSILKFFNIEVIDRAGKVIDPSTIKWQRLSRTNFPYRLREGTGCQNPLGVVKFTLTSPFDIYLHDTNFKGVFLSKNRFYSYGCVRLEDPVGLANAMLSRKIDTTFLQACFKDQVPKIIAIKYPVPVFVVYMTAETDSNDVVSYFKDIYNLLD